jgi:hypothetical protein
VIVRALPLVALLLAACPSQDSAAGDAGPIDGAPGPDAACTFDEHGFCVRVPQLRTVPRTGGEPYCSGDTAEVEDADYVCTLQHGGLDGFVYVRADADHQVDCDIPAMYYFHVSDAWFSTGGTVTAITGDYSWSHHGIDYIYATVGGGTYEYARSVLGPGGRPCDDPDCFNIVGVESGCDPRTNPAVCVRIQPDGTEPPLVDDFAANCLSDAGPR